MVRLLLVMFLTMPFWAQGAADTTRPDSIQVYGGLYLRFESMDGVAYVQKDKLFDLAELTAVYKGRSENYQRRLDNAVRRMEVDSMEIALLEGTIYKLEDQGRQLAESGERILNHWEQEVELLKWDLKRERRRRGWAIAQALPWGIVVGVIAGIVIGVWAL